MGYVPRMFIQHTSSEEQGQIYIGMVNWALMVGVVLLVIGFESSSALAAAYGVAVTGTMLITTLLSSAVVLLLWKAPRWLAVPLLLGFLLVDSLYFSANAPKILQGGAFPVIAGVALFVLMTTGSAAAGSSSSDSTKAHCRSTCSSPACSSSLRIGYKVRRCSSLPGPRRCPMRCCTTCCTTGAA